MESSSFDYSLPSVAIAQTPLSPRDSSRLLVDGETILHKHVSDLPEFLREGDLIVLNNTRVMHARLNLFKKQLKPGDEIIVPALSWSTTVWPLVQLGLDKKYDKIFSGDKIKFVYLKLPNRVRENVIAFITTLPEEFKVKNQIDY